MTIIIWLSLLNAINPEPMGLKVGDRAPGFTVRDQNNIEISLEKSLEKGKVVLTFFRGSWCRYCIKQFKGYQDSLSLYVDKNATLIAITPEKEAGIKKTIEISKATFSIVHDNDLSIMESYKVISEEKVQDYRSNYAHLEDDNSKKFLPVPATYIIDQKGIIEFVYFDPNYRVRITNRELLEML